jgi:hypothetical protein
MVASRHFREILVEVEEGAVREVSLQSGMTCSGSSDSKCFMLHYQIKLIAEPPQALLPCQIHVGLHGNVCQMGISALRYWRQLGLQPVGGKKDARALVVCDVDEGAVNAAKRFLQSLSATYEVRSGHYFE